jgi:ABC-type sugar transport system ATPase subunit
MSPSPILQLVGVEKNFGGVRALRGANLEARPGEIMGVCGENGAGKSTLLKLLGGVYPFGSYGGDVLLGGATQRFAGPADARAAGIAVVHQELSLVPELTVAQNLLLGCEPRRFGLVDETKLETVAREQVRRFGFGDQIDVTKRVGELGVGLKQMVEIVRALKEDARILVLDEPTAALTAREADLLLGWLGSLREREAREARETSATCVYVSHRLGEIFRICDRITVLRDGRTAATFVTRETTPEEVVAAMVGRTTGASPRPRPRLCASRPVPDVMGVPSARPILAVSNVSVRRAGVGRAVRRPFAVEGVSLSLAAGDVVALAGAMGSGRTALLSSLFGCARAGMTGQVAIDGVKVRLDSPRTAIDHGIAFVPEDRKGAGLVLGMTVAQNLAIPSLASVERMGTRARLGLVDPVAERQLAERRIEAHRIRGEASSVVGELSGGNQQKVVLGKWLETRPKVLLLDEPTRGVDVGAREEIYALLEGLAAEGVAILFASSDLTEVFRLAHRIIILCDGCVVREIDSAATTQEEVVQLSTSPARADVLVTSRLSRASNA